MPKYRTYTQARNLNTEAKAKLKDYDAIMGRTKKDYLDLKKKGIKCKAFNSEVKVEATNACWNHVFKHPVKRKTKVAKLERALAMDMAVKLLKKTTTYQEVSKEKDKGGNSYLSFGIIGYVRGNRIKVLVRKQIKSTNPKYVLYSFFQMSKAPTIKPKMSGRKTNAVNQKKKKVILEKKVKNT